MKKGLNLLIIVVIIICMFNSNLCSAIASTPKYYYAYSTGEFNQTEARKIIDCINDFRTGSDAWYWDSNNTNKIVCDNLNALQYDYELEKIAMQRAVECYVSWSHERPNGKSYSTAYLEVDYNCTTSGENIFFSSNSAECAHEAFREDGERYAGQGHRRAMLNSNYNCIGVACYNGFWVEEFSSNLSPKSSYTEPFDGIKNTIVELSSDKILYNECHYSNCVMEIGDVIEIPQIVCSSRIVNNVFSSGCAYLIPTDVEYSVENDSIASINNEKLYANSVGTTNITTSIFGEKIAIPIEVKRKNISDAKIKLKSYQYLYNSDGITPQILSVSLGNVLLTSEDYIVSYFDNNKPGVATVIVTGKGNYYGVAETTFNIICNHQNLRQNLTKATTSKNGSSVTKCSVCGAVKTKSTIYYPKSITLSKTSYVYDGKVKKPTVTIKDSKGNKIASSNYTVTYQSGRKNVGKYSVKITFKGNYSGSKTLYFTINPKGTSLSKVTAAKKGFKVYWKKQSTQTTGYQIQYSTNSKFSKAKTVTLSKNSYTSKSISKLSAKKKYYVRIRTYKKIGSATYYSSWSKAKYVTTKK